MELEKVIRVEKEITKTKVEIGIVHLHSVSLVVTIVKVQVAPEATEENVKQTLGKRFKRNYFKQKLLQSEKKCYS